MLKLLGSFLLAGGCSALGWQGARGLARRVALLEAWQSAAGQLHAELKCRAAALPELAAHLAAAGSEALRPAFGTLAAALKRPGDRLYAAVWRDWAEHLALPMGQEERLLLREAGSMLGRYELDSQLSALEGLQARLAAVEDRARARQTRLSRLYAMGGPLCGVAVVIVLL